ncbi:MAG: flagellar export chaperone FliS [Leptospiraceae bacterium]|nr:flagellar export chaperone FliS [Leptospiraceae bacterium]MDW8306777.1 flagellar export chaperone FliS [Leptospiraceae bacterium]
MRPGVNPYLEYQANQVSTADPRQLIVMLYEGAIRFLEASAENMKSFRTYDKANNNMLRAQDIITELMVSLDMERGGEIAKNLLSLYIFMKKQLLEANMKKSPEMVHQVIKLLRELKSAWEQIDTAKTQMETKPTSIAIEG